MECLCVEKKKYVKDKNSKKRSTFSSCNELTYNSPIACIGCVTRNASLTLLKQKNQVFNQGIFSSRHFLFSVVKTI
jgi:hypothetical protein